MGATANRRRSVVASNKNLTLGRSMEISTWCSGAYCELPSTPTARPAVISIQNGKVKQWLGN